MAKTVKFKDLVISASGNYLHSELPDNFDKLSEEELFDFIRDNAWEPLENMPADELYDSIQGSAMTVCSIIENTGIKVTGSQHF